MRGSMVDSVIVTVAPTFVGDNGIGDGVGLADEQVGPRWSWKLFC